MAVLSSCPNSLSRAYCHKTASHASSGDAYTPTGDHHQGIRDRQVRMDMDLRVPGLLVLDLLVPALVMADMPGMAGMQHHGLDHGMDPRVQDPRVWRPGARRPRN